MHNAPMKIEMIIDPYLDAKAAAAQTANGLWVPLDGGWIVTGTRDERKAEEFAKQFIRDNLCWTFGQSHEKLG